MAREAAHRRRQRGAARPGVGGQPEAFESPRIGSLPPTIAWTGGEHPELRLLDQTLLPARVRVRTCRTARDVWHAIRELCVRGAPAIGVAAAFGLCLGTSRLRRASPQRFRQALHTVARYLCTARPTAVNLAWAVRRAAAAGDAPADDAERRWQAVQREALAIAREDVEACRRIGELGAALVPDGGGVLTHCNAGALATAGTGTALALLYAARNQGKRFRVFACETRPLLQGARLTALELSSAGIEVTVLCDGMAAELMRRGCVQLVVVGADRIAANGDVANKIGTYGLAVAARHHGVPFYVAAPRSTFDPALADGSAIPIEHRAPREVAQIGGRRVVAGGARLYNPAFDVTPAALIRGIVTEVRLLEPVTAETVCKIFSVEGLAKPM